MINLLLVTDAVIVHVSFICSASSARISEMLRPFVFREKAPPPHTISETNPAKSSALAVPDNSRLTWRGSRDGGGRFTGSFSLSPGVMLIDFIVLVPMAGLVMMLVRFPLPSLFCVTVAPVIGARPFTMALAFVLFPPGGPGLIVKAKLIGFPRASRMTIFVVDV